MAIIDIQEKKAEERKREKRLVHFTNTTVRQFVDSTKFKTKNLKSIAEYITKSLLDYIFFQQHKEIGEFNEEHLRHFLLEYAPQKLEINKDTGKEIPNIITNFLEFLENEGHIKNSVQLKKVLDENTKDFIKLLPSQKPSDKKSQTKTTKESVVSEGAKVGRNDPCPCGSGKKYKHCCLLKM
ncbi:MAG: SEC-C metal-binding domain-containing protein [candidate division WOR-3 bacterium]